MSDLLISIDNSVPNRILAAAYSDADLRKRLFSGTLSTELGQIEWQFTTAPTVNLAQPSDQQWKDAIDEKGKEPPRINNTFMVTANEVVILRDGICLLTFSLGMICHTSTVKTELRLKPYALVMYMQGMSPQEIVMYKILVYEMATTILPRLNSISVSPFAQTASFGIVVGDIELAFENNRLALYGGTSGRPAGSRPTLPDGECNLLLSREATSEIVNRSLAQIVGERYETKDSKDFGIGKAEYRCSITITGARASLGGRPTELICNISLAPYASASLTIFFIPIGIAYNGTVTPSPVRGIIRIEGAGKYLRVVIQDVDGFQVLLTPSGSFSDIVLSAVALPLAQIMASTLSAAAGGMIRGNSFTFSLMDRISFPAFGKTVDIGLNINRLTDYKDMMDVCMNISVSIK